MENGDASAEKKLKIVTTTGMIADGIMNIAGDKAVVEALMGPGIDPHYYKPTQADLSSLQKADIIFYNGLHLEGKMQDVFEKLSREKVVIPISEKLNASVIRYDPKNPSVADPHIWFDVSIWINCLEHATHVLAEKDPANQAYYEERARTYLKELQTLHINIGDRLLRIPENRRFLITTHDAFGYFGQAYGIEVIGLQGISTVSDIGLRDITDMVSLITEKNIPAVFVESSVSHKSIEAVMEGCKENGIDLQLGGVLYADAMGESGTAEGTYIGMVNFNIETIVNALL